MSAPAVNGHLSAVESDDLLDAQIDKLEADLEAMLAPLRARRAELEVELMEVNAKEERIGNALRALGGRAPVAGGVRAPKPRGSAGDRNVWTPSTDVIERVAAALRGASEPLSVSQLAELTGVSRDTVNRSVKVLREQEKARLVGTQGRGNANVYLAMEA
jgi:DNA-binding transcriptional ArsR family regulator